MLDDLSIVPRTATQRSRRAAHVCYIGNKRGKKRSAVNPGKKRRQAKRTCVEGRPLCADHGGTINQSSLPSGGDYLQGLESGVTDGAEGLNVGGSRSWDQRQDTENENWGQYRTAAYEDFISTHATPSSACCTVCGMPASVACLNCPSAYLCQSCDVKEHTLQPFHKRRHWTVGFMKPLSSSTTVTADGELVPFAPLLPLHGSRHTCTPCQAEMTIGPSEAAVIAITSRGRFDLQLPVWSCATCVREDAVTNRDLMLCGYFRASPVQMSTIIHEDVFIMWRALRFRSPGTSLRAFLAMLQDLGETYGSTGALDLQRVEKAYSEWASMQYELDCLVGSDYMICEACGPDPRCVHVDGNFKLYRYRSSGDGRALNAYHVGTFIQDRLAVDDHEAKLANLSKTSNRCGVSTWSAARNKTAPPQSKRSQDETGLVAATCRHSVVLAGVNMYRGEVYAYSHFLQQNIFKNAEFFASDVACKFWPWAQRVAECFPEHGLGGTMPFLSVMHATGHAYYCQIRYGGFWQEGSGWSVMETTEIANAFLSRAGNTTKYMTAAQRIDSLTDLVLSYNKDKHDHLPALLQRKMTVASRRIAELEAEQRSLLERHNLSVNAIGELVTDLRELAASLSNRDTASGGSDLQNAIEMVSDSVRVRMTMYHRVGYTAKRRQAIARQIGVDKHKLRKLLTSYKAATGVEIAVEGAMEGCFPWHEERFRLRGQLSLSEKRHICDVHMRLCRAREEVAIVEKEFKDLLISSSFTIDQLIDKLEMISLQLSTPEDERIAILNHSDDWENRYCVRCEPDALLHGLRAIISMAIDKRRLYFNIASGYLAYSQIGYGDPLFLAGEMARIVSYKETTSEQAPSAV